MFDRAAITLGIGPHSSCNENVAFEPLFPLFYAKLRNDYLQSPKMAIYCKIQGRHSCSGTLIGSGMWSVELFDYFLFKWRCNRHQLGSDFTAPRHASAVYAVVVCLSVCHKSVFYTKTTKRRITQTTPHDSSGTLLFCCRRSQQNSNEVTPSGGAKCRWGS